MSINQQQTSKAQIAYVFLPTPRTDDEGSVAALMLETKDIHMLFTALAAYRPAEEEEQQHELLLASLEEILIRAGNECVSAVSSPEQ